MPTWFAIIFAFFTLREAVAERPCPPEGDGGDPILNRLKNRSLPPISVKPITVAQFMHDLTPNLGTPKYRNRFSAEQRAIVDGAERTAVALDGYLLAARQSGPESCNCHLDEARDFHLWVGGQAPGDKAEAKAMRAKAVVVEPTPAGQLAHPTWRLHSLDRLAQQGARVRVTGWLMYDPEHPQELDKTRGTLWELHPVTKFEVWSGGQFREL